MNDEQNPNDEELRDALEAAAVLDDDALARVEVATQVAKAAEAAEDQAVAEGDFAEAERIDEQADEVISELVVEAAVEAETAEDMVEAAQPTPVEDVAAASDEDVVVVPDAAPEPADAGSGDPFRGPGDWYVVHTYAGYENKVKANLESRIHTMQMEDKIFRVHIPMEDVMEIKSGKKQVVQKKVFPGYLLVKMLYDNDSWYVVRNTPGVTGFVSAGTGSKPTPLSKREVEKILVVKKEEQKPQVRLGFEEGDVVRIISGPFADFNGTISEINPDQAKLKVLVNIFDRETPVELSFDQVAKV
ncbi:MAG: transcription termination/antitermination protein NusG [Actinobacteria bacterium]|nr:MAG: transcription termination/antitermination protein NusG [Actinomycetota bacterium]